MHPITTTPTNLKYDILAIDMDGTLLDSTHTISDQNRAAIKQAIAVGLEIVLCTGRSLAESNAVVDEIGLTGTGIFVGGAVTVNLENRQTIRRMNMEFELVRPLTKMLNAATGYQVLLLKDRSVAGVDYRLVGKGEIDPASKWWFSQMPIAVDQFVDVEDDPHPEDTVRISLVTKASTMRRISANVSEAYGSRTFIHDFPVTTPDGNGRHLKDEAIHLMEIFRADTNKWTALKAHAGSRNVPTRRIAAIGDEINDLGMIRNAGLGIAMGNAVPAIQKIADTITARNSENGVAQAISKILAGIW